MIQRTMLIIFDSYTESPANYILTLPVAMDQVENAAEVTAYQEKVKELEAQVVLSHIAATIIGKPTRRKFSLEFKYRYFACGKFVKFKFRLS